MSALQVQPAPAPATAPAPAPGLWRAAWSHRWYVLAVLVVAGLAAWQGARLLLGPSVVVDQVKRGRLVETVVASGHVETPFRVEIGSQIIGTVQSVPVIEGQRVIKGQSLILLESHELDAAVDQARGAAAQADARMRQLEQLTMPVALAALVQARATLLEAQNTFARTQELARNGFATRAALDDAQKNRDVAQTQVQTAVLQLTTASPGGSDFVMAQTQLNQARATLDTATSRLGYATITAPRDGLLITRAVEQGSVVQPGKALLVLAPAGEIQLVLQIDERNLGLLAVGQKAVASADAYPDQRMDAVVSYINPGVDITRASVEVKLVVADPPAYLRQDMTVSVDIAVAERDNTLTLAGRSVHDALLPSPWVIGVRNGRATRLPVKLGLHGDDNMEILDGLALGDPVVPTSSGVLTGQRIRPLLP